MARIATDELERLKTEVSVERLVTAAGVKLQRHGKDLIGLCPLHDDKEPSLVVTPSANLWHCLGACQAGGSVIDWVMKKQGRELSSCGGAAPSRASFSSRRAYSHPPRSAEGARAEDVDGATTRSAHRAWRR